MQYIAEPALLTFVFQALIAIAPIVLSYPGYRWMRIPERQERIEQSLTRLGAQHYSSTIKQELQKHYNVKHYFWPVMLASLIVFILYSMTHPFIIRQGIWVGTLEEVVDIFGAPDSERAIFAGRVLFWGWLGAYIYSFNLIFRRFMSYDLTPSVYVFAATRFIMAWIIGSIVATTFGTLNHITTNMPLDSNMAMVFAIVFVIGFFPESGLDWIMAFVKRTLRVISGVAKETRLSELEGLSIWHQGRLQQVGIENVQNLAMADIPSLIIDTPFSVSQIIDWIDQAILLVYANGNEPPHFMYNQLENVGIRCASDFLTAASDEQKLQQLVSATGLSEARLKMLYLAVMSAPNIRITASFKWQTSLDATRNDEANKFQAFPATPPFIKLVEPAVFTGDMDVVYADEA